jgi:hypothetical protein
MKNYDTIGSTPAEEDCAQVGSPDYEQRARRECNAFKNQILRTFGTPPGSASISVKSFPHDFGSYLEVICNYDDESETESEYNLKCINETPTNWDEEALAELGSQSPPRQEEPSNEQLEEWMFDGVCEATDGCLVEPDGVCPHGCKSWLLELGII